MDQQLREAERRRDIRAWASSALRLGNTQLVAQLNSVKEQLEWLKKQEAILSWAIARCACGEGATHGSTCEKHQDALKKYQIVKEEYLKNPSNANLAFEMVLLGNDCGHPDRIPDRCYFPYCTQSQEYDWDCPLAFCTHHEEYLKNVAHTPHENWTYSPKPVTTSAPEQPRPPIGVHPSKQKTLRAYDELPEYLLRF